MRGGASDLSADRVDCFLYSIAGGWLKQCGRIFFENDSRSGNGRKFISTDFTRIHTDQTRPRQSVSRSTEVWGSTKIPPLAKIARSGYRTLAGEGMPAATQAFRYTLLLDHGK